MAGVSYGGYEQVELCIHSTILLHDGTKVTSGRKKNYLGLDV
jgi:hypothetical protein